MATQKQLAELTALIERATAFQKEMAESEKIVQAYFDKWHEYSELLNEISNLAEEYEVPVTVGTQSYDPAKDSYPEIFNDFWCPSSMAC